MKRILVVDDDPGVTSAMAAILVGEGYSVSIVGGMYTAMRLVQDDGPYDLAITDNDMARPDDGMVLAEQSRKIAPEMPVVLMTGSDAERVTRLSGLPCISKPFGMATLLAAVAEHLGSPQTEQARHCAQRGA